MDIEIGAEVIDKNGKKLGTVHRVVMDTYTAEIKKFTVATDISEEDLFFSPDEVQEVSPELVKLKIAYDEGKSLEVKYGAEVIDKNGKLVGTVDYPVKDTLTGEIRSFKVNPVTDTGTDIFFSKADLSEVTPEQVKLKISFTKKS